MEKGNSSVIFRVVFAIKFERLTQIGFGATQIQLKGDTPQQNQGAVLTPPVLLRATCFESNIEYFMYLSIRIKYRII